MVDRASVKFRCGGFEAECAIGRFSRGLGAQQRDQAVGIAAPGFEPTRRDFTAQPLQGVRVGAQIDDRGFHGGRLADIDGQAPAACGDLDLTGYRKPQSYYRDILWNGGDRVYATVRLPEPDGKKIIAVGWATYPTLPTWTWPGQEGKALQVEVYSGAEKVRLYLNDKLIGEQPTGRDQEDERHHPADHRAG